MKICRIQWLDHYSVNGWQDETILNELGKGVPCESIGYLVKETKKAYVLAQSVSVGTLADLITILKSCVIKVETLGELDEG